MLILILMLAFICSVLGFLFSMAVQNGWWGAFVGLLFFLFSLFLKYD